MEKRIAVALIVTLLSAAGAARATSPYEIFRLGMSETEAVAAAKEHRGDILDVYEREGGEPRTMGAFRVLFGDIPVEPYQATGMFVFEHDRLKQMRFDYQVWEEHTPAGICRSVAEHAVKEITELYGAPSEPEEFSGSKTELRGKITAWKSEEFLVSIFAADAPPLSADGSCDIVWVELFDGNAEELEAFIVRQQEAIRKSKK